MKLSKRGDQTLARACFSARTRSQGVTHRYDNIPNCLLDVLINNCVSPPSEERRSPWWPHAAFNQHLKLSTLSQAYRMRSLKGQNRGVINRNYGSVPVLEWQSRSDHHNTSTLIPFDLNRTEPQLELLPTPVFTLLFRGKMAAAKKVNTTRALRRQLRVAVTKTKKSSSHADGTAASCCRNGN